MTPRKDLLGQKFGKLTVIENMGIDDKGNTLWKCKCDCGGEKITNTHSLSTKHTTSCGCLYPKAEDLTGKRFGRLKVVKRVADTFDKANRRYITWECLCDCGKTTYATTNNLHGKTTSCGCYLKEVAGKQTLKHGFRKTRIYTIYNGMKQRCNNPKTPEYNAYGGRGIKVCEQWNKPDGLKSFAEWAFENGYKDNLTIERIDVNGDYCPENCTWIPKNEQAKNTQKTVRVIYNGGTLIASDFARLVNIDRRTVYRKIKEGLTPNEIVMRYSK